MPRGRIRKRRFVKKKISKEEMEKMVVELAKKEDTSSQIGLILYDKFKTSTKKELGIKITKILKKHNLQPKLPEDLMNLMKKAVKLHEHLQKHKEDKHSKRGLELLESRIRRLAKYYISKGLLPKGWKYSYDTARLIVEK